jgi:hypothetical protein
MQLSNKNRGSKLKARKAKDRVDGRNNEINFSD